MSDVVLSRIRVYICFYYTSILHIYIYIFSAVYLVTVFTTKRGTNAARPLYVFLLILAFLRVNFMSYCLIRTHNKRFFNSFESSPANKTRVLFLNRLCLYCRLTIWR